MPEMDARTGNTAAAAENAEIKEIWEGDAGVYDKGVKKELENAEGDAAKWAELVLARAPQEGPLQILDCGTGPGFFPVILGKRGHHVTGIDLTENMILKAKENVQAAGVTAELRVMDCQETDFADNTFDMIISRNITWTLSNPPKAYREWQRILRPGGRLLVFDGNYYLHLFDEERMKTFRYLDDRMKKERGHGIFSHSGAGDTFADVSAKLFMSSRRRPQWDLECLLELGFREVFAVPDIRTCMPGQAEPANGLDREMQAFMPLFLVGGEKAV